jgi:NAD-dependent dihydropyrimidine dehydrogenase PreA subunit
MLEVLERITDGKGTLEDIDELESLAAKIKATALCGLGQTAPNPVMSTLRNFRDEYIAHVVDKKCPAGVCKSLLRYAIDPEKCKGCSACSRACPANAISGEIRKPFTIDPSKCIKCGACMDTCRFGAVSKV